MASRHQVISGCAFAGQAGEGGIEIDSEEDALGVGAPAESGDALTIGALVRGTCALHRIAGVADKRLSDKPLPSQRLKLAQQVAQTCEKLLDADIRRHSHSLLSNLANACHACVRALENARVKHHVAFSSNTLSTTHGLTEDACLFLAVCLCRQLLFHADPGRAPESSPCDLAGVPFQGVVLSELQPWQVDVCLSSVFQHQALIQLESEQLRTYTRSLEARCSQLLTGHVTGEQSLIDYEVRRSQWACAIARIKNACIDRVSHRTNQNNPVVDLPVGGNAAADSDTGDEEEEVEAELARDQPHQAHRWRISLQEWFERNISEWDGPRFRESVARAYKRRVIRADETGRNTAFAGNSFLRRSRGALDTSEEALHSIPFDEVIKIQSQFLFGNVRVLADVLRLKLVANALEAIANLQFLEAFVFLDSNRDRHKQLQAIGTKCIIVEQAGRWYVRKEAFVSKLFKHLHDALELWYSIQFRSGRDLLGLFSS